MAVKIDSIFDLSNVFSLGYLGIALSKYAAEQGAITTHSAFTPLFFVVIVLLVVTVSTVLPVLFGKVRNPARVLLATGGFLAALPGFVFVLIDGKQAALPWTAVA